MASGLPGKAAPPPRGGQGGRNNGHSRWRHRMGKVNKEQRKGGMGLPVSKERKIGGMGGGEGERGVEEGG